MVIYVNHGQIRPTQVYHMARMTATSTSVALRPNWAVSNWTLWIGHGAIISMAIECHATYPIVVITIFLH